MSDLDEVVSEFLVESLEGLDRMEDDLLTLERVPDDGEALASMFRAIHTIKGTCGFFGFPHLERLAHVAENLLGDLRDGKLRLSAQITSALLSTIDAVRELLGAIETTGAEGEPRHEGLIALLEALRETPAEDTGPVAEALPAALAAESAPAEPAEPAPAEPAEPEQQAVGAPRLGELLISTGAVSRAAIEAAARQQRDGDPRPLGEILVDRGDLTQAALDEALGHQQTRLAESSVRVDVARLEQLMNLVGELVLVRNQVLQIDGVAGGRDLTSVSQRLDSLTGQLQEAVMRTRMQPVGNVFGKLPRVARDLALQFGKQLRVEIGGRETELDRTIIEAIRDPLTHLVRNAVDHGLETPEERLAAGKPAEGLIRVGADHAGGQVTIEISDDGRGIDLERVKERAVQKGLIGPDAAGALAPRQAAELLFTPSFSTAAKVTNVSGRGVGLDVVRTNIERIGGVVDLQSEPGAGTTVRLRIPLTLAILPALVVSAAGQRFVLPQSGVQEVAGLDRAGGSASIEHIGATPVYRLRDRLLPLLCLADELGLPGGLDQARCIVVLQSDGERFGLLVDAVHDTQEIVVKPLGRVLKELSVYAGATILGDGQVSLILDVSGLAERSGVLDGSAAELPADTTTAAAAAATEELLVVDLGRDHRAALPLSDVDRLEELPAELIDTSAEGPVARHGGAVLPLVRLSELLGIEPSQTDRRSIDVVVTARGGRRLGLVVDRIVDIVDEPLGARTGGSTFGVSGTVILRDRVTDVIDLSVLLPELAVQ